MSCAAAIRCLLLAGVLAACSSAPTLSDDARTARRADGLVRELVHAYQSRDLQKVLAGFAPDLLNRDDIRRAVEEAFARFDRIELDVAIDRIHLSDQGATVFLHWDGRWRRGAGDPLVRQGTARFMVTVAERALVSDVVGESPFGPVPDAASRS